MGRKILITGGAGFIGSHLCRALLSRGDHVLCVDNYITGARENIEDCLPHENFSLREHDISEPMYVKGGLDWVLHFASIASPKEYLAYPIKTLKSGLLGTHNCLGIAKEKGARFLLASTSEVYGDPARHPQPEEYWGNVNPIGERSCYDESKRAAEALTYAYYRQHKVQVSAVRIFNTYGPHMQVDDGRVVSNFIVQALRGQKVTVYGKGSQTRSFCYVDDLARGILAVMETEYAPPLNIGNPQEYTIEELARQVCVLTGSGSALEYAPLPADDPVRRRPDISKIQSLCGWQPEVSLQDGLQRTIEYFKNKLSKR
ncbi:MAG: NAD-dependent epimerase/dehydratase family protein [Candidatus Omnitrophica bacterium]|nr:NAD-dependent epimerase/dehydratase family protein [Candidatus Omnitrophota bacterium]